MSSHRKLLLWSAGLFLLVVLLYIPTLRGGFVYDSIAQVLYSDYIHTPSHWVDLVTLRVVGQDELDRNRPLHLASLMLDAAIWGKNPFGYRLTSVLLHALNAALLFVFLTVVLRGRTTGGGDAAATSNVASPSSATAVYFCAAFGALVFALHPLVVEAVAEPSNREDLLVLLPLWIGLLAIVSPVRSRRGVMALLVVCSFFAVLAKESGLAVPLVFALACWLFRRGEFRILWPGLVGGLLTSVASLAASYVWRPEASGIFAHEPGALAGNFFSSLAVQLRIWTLQFSQIIWPWHLSAHYAPGSIAGISFPVAVVSTLAVAAAATFAWRTDRLAALGVGVYVLCLLPASNFASQYHPMADRYLYVPLAGLGMVAAAMVFRVGKGGWSAHVRRATLAGLLLLLSLEYAANLRRQLIWQQPAALWSDVLRQYPNMPQAQIGLANVHYRAGDFESARVAATEAVMSSNGRWGDAWALRAICEWQTGARAQAVESLRRARSLSRVYFDEQSAAAAMILSPEQLSSFGEVLRASGD